MLSRSLMIAAALCSTVVALLHVYIMIEGPWAYRFFGAGEELATLAEQGSWMPTLLTSFITLVFFIFAAYYFAGAGLLPPPPLFRWALLGIAVAYLLRGSMLAVAPMLKMSLSSFDVWSSLISLAVGLLHCAAVWSLNSSASAAAGAHA